MTAPQPQPGCSPGCGKIIGYAALLVLALWVFGQACAPETSPSPSIPQGDPIQAPEYDYSLCEGSDYVLYDDCKRY